MKRSTKTQAPPPDATVVYARKSNEDDNEKELKSVATQAKAIKTYAAKNKLRIVAEFEDDGISGQEFKKRPGLQRLIAFAKTGAFSQLMVRDVERWGRELFKGSGYLGELADAGVKYLHTLDGAMSNVYDLNNPMHKQMIMLRLGVAEGWVESLRAATKAALAERKAAGRPCRRPLYGFKTVGRIDPATGKLKDKRHVPDPKVVPVVRRIFREYASG